MKAVSKKQPRAQSLWRLYLVVGVLLSMLALLVGRVVSLQVLDTERGHQFLQNQGAMRGSG